MAEKLKTFGDKNQLFKRGKVPDYPWPQWCDGDVWKVEAGKDFQGPIKNFQTTLHWRARSIKEKVRTRTSIVGKRQYVIFQFTKKGKYTD